MSRRVLVIVPTLNEVENVRVLLPQILAIVPPLSILVVDDDSPDGTADVVSELSRRSDGRIAVLRRKGEPGLGRAYTAGLMWGFEQHFDVLMTMDADLSHNPAHIPAILEALDDHDVVVGSRYIRDGGVINWQIRRILLSWLANRFARLILGLRGHDLTSGFRAYSRAILERVPLQQIRSNGYSYLVEMLFHVERQRGRVGEVPIVFFDRTCGVSKISKREVFRGALTLLRLRFSGS